MKSETTSESLERLLKYCLGYVKLINPAFSRYKVYTDPIDSEILDSNFLFTLDTNDNSSLLLNLKEFYGLNPKDLTDENKDKYLKQKELATKLEEIKNKYKVGEYTKQIILNFGYFYVEIPENQNLVDDISENDESPVKIKSDFHPLFSIPIEIDVKNGKYYLEILDQNVIPNLGFLQDLLGEDAYYEFSDFVNQLEINDDLTIPLNKNVVTKIWEELKARLKLSEAQFDENSFVIERIVVSLSSRSNYFLVQDLKTLTEISEEELLETSLSGWVSDEDLPIEGNVDEDSGELFFPFDYDKYQLRVLPIINNKSSIIQGPPGTGKSQTIANLLCHLAANGKRVLFLSQKAQALKVVKDYLKKLDIEYLYGYIPNRYSHTYSKEEETDGASYTLAGIKEYVSFVHDMKAKDDNLHQESLSEIKNYFGESIEQHRTFYYLQNNLQNLEEFNFEPVSTQNYYERFNYDKYNELKSLQNEIDKLTSLCGDYIKNNSDVNKLEKRFEGVSFETNNYAEVFESLTKEVAVKGYDRGNPIGNFLSDNILLLRLRNTSKKLPRELLETFESIVRKNLSRAKTVAELKEFQDFFYYKEYTHQIKELRERLSVHLLENGLDNVSLTRLEKLIPKYPIKETIEKTKKYLELKKQIKNLKLENLNVINKSLHEVRHSRREKVKNFIRNRVKDHIIEATYSKTIRGLVARIARALQKSKRAYRTFDQLKKDPNNFQTLKEIVPIWIMDLEDASRLIPLEKNMFDYIILDEASQCNLAYAIPAMYRSQHVVFFGDSEQMRDDSIKFKTNRSLLDLAQKYKIPEYLQIKSKDDAVKSVLDIGGAKGFMSTTLLYHYRSPKELIGFSNDNFYAPKRKRLEVINTNYLPYKNTNKIMINHFVKPQRELDTSEKTNVAEAKYIASLVKELQSDLKTKDKSIAVLTFFNEQAFILKEYIDDDNIKISIIEGIQGDERDIIIYSFVICSPDEKRRYIPLTGEQGEINKELNAGRVNVAFSRARLQVHCVASLPIEKFPEGIWIKRYLEHIETNGKIDFYNQELKKFDSKFEEEFYYFVRNELGKEFIIQNQVESCGFKIDFVLTDTNTNKVLAIECDGPTHFEDEISDVYVSSDLERQNILESAGWDFYRLAYADWINKDFTKNTIIKDLKDYFSQPSHFLKSLKKLNTLKTQQVPFEYAVDEITQYEQKQTTLQKSTPTKSKADFEEVARVDIDDRRDLVISLIDDGQSYWINEYLKSGSYIGFSNKGIGLAKKDVGLFVLDALTTLKNGQTTSVQWKGSGNSKIIIQKLDEESTQDSVLDIRQYVESSKFTGFTKRGFRLHKEQFEKFIDTLSKLS